ncbi:hypothetical protein MASR1M97_09010 [Candidatus Desulfobacillus denitrificans]|uniref:Uncharacterized protein n=1 Tax=Candidatus Desulfobacillus denitrificans TaxID=2608985 RepID=A0A809R7Z0_9PROT|nr:conserved hypothetical protein [Candidatus Desulfobacillus denitrificans]GIK44473.1 MAG: hypothetical protein BroJett012_03760 [Betaproteobacteria bacterium]
MLTKVAPFDPDARCCWECTHGGKPSKCKTIICAVDGNIVFRLVPGHCPAFCENERAVAQRRRRAARLVKTVFPAR